MATDLRIAALNCRIHIEQPVRVPDGRGGQVKSWEPAASDPNPWAQMIPLRGDEALNQALVEARQLWKVTTRWRDDVTPDNRLVWDGRVLNIRTAEDPDRRRKWLVMTAESGVKS